MIRGIGCWNLGYALLAGSLLAVALGPERALSADPERPPSQSGEVTAEMVLEETTSELELLQDVAPLMPAPGLLPEDRSTAGSSLLPRSNFAERQAGLRQRAIARNRAPAMIGDFFGGGQSTQIVVPGLPLVTPVNFPGLEASVPIVFPNSPVQRLGFDVPVPFSGAVHDSLRSTLVVNAGFQSNPDALVPLAAPPLVFNTVATQLVRSQFSVLPTGERVSNATVDFVGGIARFDSNNSPPFSTGRPLDPLDQFFLTYYYQYDPNILVNLPSPGLVDGNVGRVKLAENTSPIPRDRIMLFYSYFDNVALIPGGTSVNRWTPGFEKTVFGGRGSVEVRVPLATTLDTDIVTNGTTNTGDLQFGNLGVIGKALIYENDDFVLSSGLQMSFPTANDVRVERPNGDEVLRIENESVHLQPFVGALYTPNDRFFTQAFFQIDTVSNGNPVVGRVRDGGERLLGKINAPTYLYLDLNAGYWIYRNDSGLRRLTGIAPMGELHYNRTMQNTDRVDGRFGNQQFSVRSTQSSIETINLVIGSTLEFDFNTTLTLGYATPISGGNDKDFDGELRLVFNHRFGPQSVRTRAF